MAILLPQEIYDTIIDHLAFEKKTLKACSIVCTTFLPRSRYHLFYKISIAQGGLSFPPSYTAAVGPPAILSSMQTFSKYIRELDICQIPLEDIKVYLPQLESLRIHYHWFQKYSAVPDTMRNIRTLTMSNVTFSSLDQFTALVSSFPALENLCMSGISCLSADPVAAHKHCVPQTLKNLRIPMSSGLPITTDILDWLTQSKQQDLRLDTLSVEWIESPQELASVSRFLSSTHARHIRNLTLSLHPYASGKLTSNNIVDCLGLCSLPSLHSLHLPDLVIGSYAEATSNVNESLVQIIRRLLFPRNARVDSGMGGDVNVPSDPVQVDMEVRVAGLSDLGQSDSVEFDWDQLAKLAPVVPGPNNDILSLERHFSDVKMRVLLSSDELIEAGVAGCDSGDLAMIRVRIEGYVRDRLSPGGIARMVWIDWLDD